MDNSISGLPSLFALTPHHVLGVRYPGSRGFLWSFFIPVIRGRSAGGNLAAEENAYSMMSVLRLVANQCFRHSESSQGKWRKRQKKKKIHYLTTFISHNLSIICVIYHPLNLHSSSYWFTLSDPLPTLSPNSPQLSPSLLTALLLCHRIHQSSST